MSMVGTSDIRVKFWLRDKNKMKLYIKSLLMTTGQKIIFINWNKGLPI